MTKVNPDNENETKSDIFPQGITKSDVISLLSKYIKVFFNDLQNRNFSVLRLK